MARFSEALLCTAVLIIVCFVAKTSMAVDCNGVYCGEDDLCRTVSCHPAGTGCMFTTISRNLERTCPFRRKNGEQVTGVCREVPTGTPAQCQDLCAGKSCPQGTFCEDVRCNYKNGACKRTVITDHLALACVRVNGTTGICRLTNTTAAGKAKAVCN